MLHRFFAASFVGIFLWHISYIFLRIGRNWKTFRRRSPQSMIPHLGDLNAAIGMFKWFFGLAPKPQLDRWTYWEKFDYWAPFWGVAIIGGSGAMLSVQRPDRHLSAGPGVQYRHHLPRRGGSAGRRLPVHRALLQQSLAAGQIPARYPDVTGKMPLEEFKREHLIEYNRLVASGELQKYLVDAPSQPMTFASKIWVPP